MMAGFLAGITRMILDFSYPAPSCNEEDTRPAIIKDVHFFYVALILFVLTAIVCVIVSLLTEPPDDELVRRYSILVLRESLSLSNLLNATHKP